MSISNPVGAPYDERAADLVARVDQDQWGSVGPSLYETARVLSAAPWLPGEPRRITYLLEQQAPDGSWGTDRRTTGSCRHSARWRPHWRSCAGAPRPRRSPAGFTAAVDRGLGALRSLPPAGPWPDTAAAEILVPGLVAGINEKLDSPAADGGDMPGSGGPRLPVPGGFHGSAPARVAGRYESAGSLPVKYHHTFEGIAGCIPPSLVPDAEGLLGSSCGRHRGAGSAVTRHHRSGRRRPLRGGAALRRPLPRGRAPARGRTAVGRRRAGTRPPARRRSCHCP